MLDAIRRLFRRRPADPEPGSLVEELWLGEMSGPEKGRFLETVGADYAARYARPQGLELELSRPDLFAWTEAPLYRHSDFVLEGEFAMGQGLPHSACGFLFRYQDEANFYSVLVSNRGFFRFDVIFNGSPRALVAWTETPRSRGESPPSEGEGESSLRIIARGGHFTIVLDGEWAAEAADESFDRGHLAFAAQNYGEGGATRFSLLSCMVDSRPLEVETWYFRWNYYIVPGADARRRLAETLFAMGESLAAAVQLRKIERRRPLDADELFLKAETALRLGLQDEAEARPRRLPRPRAWSGGRQRGEGQPPLPARPLPRAARPASEVSCRRCRTTRACSASRATPASPRGLSRERRPTTAPPPRSIRSSPSTA